MYIKSVILDGFKSYGKRTEVNGFDPEFTAITGLNGTGKSNLLDSICFVLGISNLGQVRATSLQELVYKGGQAGITSASVTILFDNTDSNQCPIGYEKCREISITRQVGGNKNKYFINGKTVQNKRVADLFCSVQLNVNNPNFLIMQGRITKVLNMKPHEILSMIEEAAGTSMYESKRDITAKMMDKKESKLNEMDTLLEEEIKPKLEKLREERAQYIEYQKIVRDIEYLTRIHISYKYLQYQKEIEHCVESVHRIELFIENSKQKIKDNEAEAVQIEQDCKDIQHNIDNETGGQLEALEQELTAKTKEEAIAIGARKSSESALETENRKLKSLEKSVKDDEKVLQNKEQSMAKVSGLFESLKTADENDRKLFADAKKKFEAISSGLAVNEDGEAASLQDQLMTSKQKMSEAATIVKQSEMELKYKTVAIRDKQSESQTNDASYTKDRKMMDNLKIEIQRNEEAIAKMNYTEGTLEALDQQRGQLAQQRRQIKSDLDRKNAYQFDFQYVDPMPNFDRRRVLGRICNLFRVKDERYSLALSMCAGGSLYSVVTDTDETSKLLIQRGQLQSRTTMVPINKIQPRSIPPSTVKFAQNLVGSDNVASAMSLIEYDPKVEAVMQFIFGRTFICKDMNAAKQVTYHRQILCPSVTWEGDKVDPEGTLSGGSAPKGGSVLQQVAEVRQLNEACHANDLQSQSIADKLLQLHSVAQAYQRTKEKLELNQMECKLVEQRLAMSSVQQHQQEIDELKTEIETLKEEIVKNKVVQKTESEKVADIQAKLADAKGYREREMKSALDEMKRSKAKSEESQKNWQRREQECETLSLEIEELKRAIEQARQQIVQITETIETMREQISGLNENTKGSSDAVAELKRQIKEQKDKINSQNKELKSKLQRKDKMTKQNQELQLEMKKKDLEINTLKNENKDGFNRVKSLEVKYKWIEEDKQYFGVKNTRYDYSKEDPEVMGKKLHLAQSQKDKMERRINLKAMMLLEREEEQFREVEKRKKIVYDDKLKIQKIISDLDEKKKTEVKKAWQAVDLNFGRIYSSLLPGAQASLVPPDGVNFLKGLTVRVGFNGMWKESLNELSGGQRSLVALSLILAMLKFKPAPLYILDEVDAALDMSHTQNIGNMLKAHFKNSQFIIVSLKDGMFNNANVLLKTKFEDGVSAVTRTVNSNLLKRK